jgi:hypothetical protein
MRAALHSHRSVYSVCIIAAVCISLWVAFDFIKDVAGRGVSLAVSALIFIISLIILKVWRPNGRQH